jgi:hypothetical protein
MARSLGLIVCLFHVPELTFSHKFTRASSHKYKAQEGKKERNLNIIETKQRTTQKIPLKFFKVSHKEIEYFFR